MVDFNFFSINVWGIDLDYCDVEQFYDLLELTPKTMSFSSYFIKNMSFSSTHKKICPFAFHWNAKVRSQEIPEANEATDKQLISKTTQ